MAVSYNNIITGFQTVETRSVIVIKITWNEKREDNKYSKKFVLEVIGKERRTSTNRNLEVLLGQSGLKNHLLHIVF